MNNTIIFGEKDVFAIELGETKQVAMYKLRFWINNSAVGNFKKAGGIKQSIKEFNRFIENKERFYLDLFDDLPPLRIYYYLLDMLSDKSGNPDESNKKKEFYLLFGEQFNTATSGIILLYKDDKVRFLLPRKAGVIDEVEIPYEEFYKVVGEYRSYCESVQG